MAVKMARCFGVLTSASKKNPKSRLWGQLKFRSPVHFGFRDDSVSRSFWQMKPGILDEETVRTEDRKKSLKSKCQRVEELKGRVKRQSAKRIRRRMLTSGGPAMA